MLWTIYLVNFLFLFYCLFFQHFFLVLSIKTNSSVSSFFLTSSVSMKLGETVTYCSLEGVSLCGSFPIQSACAQLLWWESRIWCEDESCFPPACAGICHLGRREGWRWRGSGKIQVWVRASPLLSDQHHPLEGGGRSHVAGAEALRFRSELAPFPLSVCFPHSPHSHPCPSGEQCWNKRGWPRHSPWVWAQAMLALATVSNLDCFWCSACVSTSDGCPAPLRCCSRSEPPLCLTAEISPQPQQPSPQGGAVSTLKQAGLELVLSSHWGLHQPWGKLASVPCSFSLPSLPCFGSKQACVRSSWVESRLPTAFLLVPLTVLQPAKGTCLPSVRPQGLGAQYVALTTYSPERISAL